MTRLKDGNAINDAEWKRLYGADNDRITLKFLFFLKNFPAPVLQKSQIFVLILEM